MTLRALTALLLIARIAVLGPANAADRTVRDTGQPSYQLLIPDGWELASQQAPQGTKGVTLKRGDASATLWIKPGVAQPGAVLVQIKPQLQQQWKNFREVESGKAMLAGQKAAYGVYSGVAPSGGQMTMKVVTMTDGQFTYLLFLEASISGFATKADLDRIQSSFALLNRAQ